jgi:hypothetical protein
MITGCALLGFHSFVKGVTPKEFKGLLGGHAFGTSCHSARRIREPSDRSMLWSWKMGPLVVKGALAGYRWWGPQNSDRSPLHPKKLPPSCRCAKVRSPCVMNQGAFVSFDWVVGA